MTNWPKSDKPDVPSMTKEDTNAVIERALKWRWANSSRAQQDDLHELIRLARIGVSLEGEGVVERVARAIFDGHNKTYGAIGACRWESDPGHWRRYAIDALKAIGGGSGYDNMSELD